MPRQAESTRRPDFFIVGAPKCGTTAMNDFLAEHPDIYMGQKELHFFMEWSTRTERDYLGYFRGAGKATRVGEASVNYLGSQTAAERIALFELGCQNHHHASASGRDCGCHACRGDFPRRREHPRS